MSNIKAAIVTIGDELLIGQTIDTNSAWIAKQLNALGIEVARRVAVGDTEDAIRTALDEELKRASVVLLTGGLGPTSDDITKPFLCSYFGGKLVVDEKTRLHLLDLFARRGRPILERNMKQAEVPDNCTVLFNRMGTAPGMMFHQNDKIIVAMPGVPFEMMAIMEDEVLPYLQQHIKTDALLHETIITGGEAESIIAEKIKDLEDALPATIKLAYLPSPGMVKLRLTGRGADKLRLKNELKLRQEELAARLSDIVVAMEDLPLETILGRQLTIMQKTLGLAESCTGGFIGHHITQVIGSANYFNGGVICYQNETKEKLLGVNVNTIEQYGAVSEQTAIEMVVGALKALNCDYALSVTGVLSPGGESNRVPVGTVWMAVANKEKVHTKHFRFHYDRERNKDMSAQMGMLLLWRFINNKL